MKRLFSTFALCLWAVLYGFSQKVFTIEGTVAPEITDSCYNVYIGDEYFHIDGDKVDMCVPVVDKKFHVEIPCEKVTCARIRCIFPGGELCSAWIDFYAVPGETLKLTVGNGHYNWDPTYSYYQKIQRGVAAARKAAKSLITPYTPKFKGTKWNAVTQDAQSLFYVKDVTFGKDETILHLMCDQYLSNPYFGKEAYITDENGNKYEIIRAEIGALDDNQNMEMRAYGGYYVFKPVPKGTKSINFFLKKSEKPYIADIKENTRKLAGNFNIKINVSPDITDCGYLISLHDKNNRYSTVIDEVSVVDKKSSFSMHLDEIRVADLTAIFPDGSICQYCVRIPFVPGENAEVTVKNGTFFLTGKSGFYKEWGDADDYFDKIEKETNKEELIVNYFKEHNTEKGCIYYYEMRNALPLATIVKMLPESVVASDYGVQLISRAAEIEKKQRAREEYEKKVKEMQKNTQEGMMFTDFSVEYDGKTHRLSDYVGKGKYVLVDFWASWCRPCLGEIPNLKNVWNKYKGDKFEVLGVAVGDKPEASLNALKENGVEYPQIINTQSVALDAYGINGIPEIILFAPDGKILKRGLRGAMIERTVKEYLEK